MTAFNDPNVIYVGPHDWEFNEGWENHTQGIIYAMNRFITQSPSDWGK